MTYCFRHKILNIFKYSCQMMTFRWVRSSNTVTK